MSTLAPRVVTVSRPSELDTLLARHGTLGAAEYFLRQRGRELTGTIAAHEALMSALTMVSSAVPADWRQARVGRDDLPRFPFGPEDIIVAVGPDGLVANVAKYLNGQPVIGVDPEPGRNPGVLVRFAAPTVASTMATLLASANAQTAATETRTMVCASLDDGQQLLGLNEVYIGHPSHQSSRYLLSTPGGTRERQSSSGLIVATGTGATGWCASIAGERATTPPMPAPEEAALCWYVREAWPSPSTGASHTAGVLRGDDQLVLGSESERLVGFADGVEPDHLTLVWGQRVSIGLASRTLTLVVPSVGR